MYVPEDIKKRADGCEHNFSCLETGKCGENEMCKVNDIDGQDVLFLDRETYIKCPYSLKFASEYMCRCPVHYYMESHKDHQGQDD